MAVKNNQCETCGKTEQEFYDFNGVEMCKECFETLFRISQFKSLNDIHPEEGKILLNALRLMVKSMVNPQ